jgi:hypothetical protein
MEPPDAKAITSSIERLTGMGGLTEDQELTVYSYQLHALYWNIPID